MRVTTFESDQELLLVRGLLSSIELVETAKAFRDQTGSNLFVGKHANIVAGWATKHLDHYQEPLFDSLDSYYNEWASRGRSDASQESMEKFLDACMSTPPIESIDYLKDLLAKTTTKNRLRAFATLILEDIEDGHVDKAVETASTIDMASVDQSSYVDPSTGLDDLTRAFEAPAEGLIRYPGALQTFLGQSLTRDSFVSFLGPEKRGKSFWLLDAVCRGWSQGLRVAYFEVGDMSKPQVLRRLGSRFAKRPSRPGKVKYPTQLLPPEKKSGTCEVEYKVKEFPQGLTGEIAARGMQRAVKKLKIKDDMLRLSCHSNSSISATDILVTTKRWARLGWVPDLIVIDYADILAPCKAGSDVRESINATWKALRRLSQDLHCCVLTATQAAASGYSATTLGMQDFSEDKRKLSHVTGMVGINQAPEHRSMGVQELNWIVLRDDEFIQSKKVYVAGCFSLANPAILSVY